MNAHSTEFIRDPGHLLPDTEPSLLRDLWPTVAEHDRRAFKLVAQEFASGMNATIEGSHRAVSQWIKGKASAVTQANRAVFLKIVGPHAREIKDRRNAFIACQIRERA